jgi:heme/copper-type cytochrome/quinol oxidase subunit 1
VLADLLRSWRKGGPVVGDPYEGLTLEWATTSPPPAHGFDTVPMVWSSTPQADWRAAATASATEEAQA